MKKVMTYLAIVGLLVPLILSSGCGDDVTIESNTYYEDLVAKGWRLLQRWDFYNELDGWNHKTITRKNSGGFVKVENGVLEFGFSKNGGIVFFQNKVKSKPKTSYMIVARIKTLNPFRAMVGFFSPDQKDKASGQYWLRGAVRVRHSDWQIVKSILSLDPNSGVKKPRRLYPAIQNISRHDYTYVDWVELWVYPKQKR